jgi:hypothetical protein
MGLFHRLTVASVGVLCLLVGAAGAVGVWARLNNTWEHFFLMEQTFATLTPIVVVIGAIALIASIGAVLSTG